MPKRPQRRRRRFEIVGGTALVGVRPDFRADHRPRRGLHLRRPLARASWPVAVSAVDVAMTAGCLWCSALLPAGRGRGSQRRFCSTDCRSAFHTAARRWALAEIAAGRLTVAQLKECRPESVHAFSRGRLASAATPLAKTEVAPRRTRQRPAAGQARRRGKGGEET